MITYIVIIFLSITCGKAWWSFRENKYPRKFIWKRFINELVQVISWACVMFSLMIMSVIFILGIVQSFDSHMIYSLASNSKWGIDTWINILSAFTWSGLILYFVLGIVIIWFSAKVFDIAIWKYSEEETEIIMEQKRIKRDKFIKQFPTLAKIFKIKGV